MFIRQTTGSYGFETIVMTYNVYMNSKTRANKCIYQSEMSEFLWNPTIFRNFRAWKKKFKILAKIELKSKTTKVFRIAPRTAKNMRPVSLPSPKASG